MHSGNSNSLIQLTQITVKTFAKAQSASQRTWLGLFREYIKVSSFFHPPSIAQVMDQICL